VHGCPDQPVFGLIFRIKAATVCPFDTMAAARKARELGEALVRVEGNANKARRLISRGADVNYVYRLMHEGEYKCMKPMIQAERGGPTSTSLSHAMEKQLFMWQFSRDSWK
jgi:hypothetical protein